MKITQHADHKTPGKLSIDLDTGCEAGRQLSRALFRTEYGYIIASYPRLLMACGRGKNRTGSANGYTLMGGYFGDGSYIFVLVHDMMVELFPNIAAFVVYAGQGLPDRVGPFLLDPKADQGSLFPDNSWLADAEQLSEVADFDDMLAEHFGCDLTVLANEIYGEPNAN